MSVQVSQRPSYATAPSGYDSQEASPTTQYYYSGSDTSDSPVGSRASSPFQAPLHVSAAQIGCRKNNPSSSSIISERRLPPKKSLTPQPGWRLAGNALAELRKKMEELKAMNAVLAKLGSYSLHELRQKVADEKGQVKRKEKPVEEAIAALRNIAFQCYNNRLTSSLTPVPSYVTLLKSWKFVPEGDSLGATPQFELTFQGADNTEVAIKQAMKAINTSKLNQTCKSTAQQGWVIKLELKKTGNSLEAYNLLCGLFGKDEFKKKVAGNKPNFISPSETREMNLANCYAPVLKGKELYLNQLESFTIKELETFYSIYNGLLPPKKQFPLEEVLKFSGQAAAGVSKN